MATRATKRTRGRGPVKGPTDIKPQLQYSIAAMALQPIPQMPGQNAIIAPFDKITSHGVVPLAVQFVILDCWTSGFGHFSEYVAVTDPSGDVLIQTPETAFWLQNQASRHNVNHSIVAEFRTPGLYPVRIYLDNNLVLEYKLSFVIQGVPGTFSS